MNLIEKLNLSHSTKEVPCYAVVFNPNDNEAFIPDLVGKYFADYGIKPHEYSLEEWHGLIETIEDYQFRCIIDGVELMAFWFDR